MHDQTGEQTGTALNLSSGGHITNIPCYPLISVEWLTTITLRLSSIRRRCRLSIHFSDLSNSPLHEDLSIKSSPRIAELLQQTKVRAGSLTGPHWRRGWTDFKSEQLSLTFCSTVPCPGHPALVVITIMWVLSLVFMVSVAHFGFPRVLPFYPANLPCQTG